MVKSVGAYPWQNLSGHIRGSTMARAKVERGLMWQFAMRLLSNMAEALVERNTIRYHAVIWARMKGREWQLVVVLLSTLAQALKERITIWQHFPISAC